MIIQLQEDWESGKYRFKKQLGNAYNLTNITVDKYLSMSEDEIKSLDNPKKYKKRIKQTDGYENIIYKMAKDNISPGFIASYVMYKGYDGTLSALFDHIKRIYKNNFGIILPRGWEVKFQYPEGTVIIKRSDIVKYICDRSDEDNEVKVYYELLIENYPVIDEVKKIYDDFYDTIMGKDTNRLDQFIVKYRESRINSFVGSIEKDITPAKNAISFEVSSGFVEGNNNKFKLIKRILYGRSRLVNLFKKCYVSFLLKQEEFNIASLFQKKR